MYCDRHTVPNILQHRVSECTSTDVKHCSSIGSRIVPSGVMYHRNGIFCTSAQLSRRRCLSGDTCSHSYLTERKKYSSDRDTCHLFTLIAGNGRYHGSSGDARDSVHYY